MVVKLLGLRLCSKKAAASLEGDGSTDFFVYS